MGKYENLSRLQKLKDDGILTEAEFKSEKEKILNTDIETKNKSSNTTVRYIFNNKIVIVVAIFILLIIFAIIFFKSKPNEIEKEIIEVVNNLNINGNEFGDWDDTLYITKINQVKKIDYELLDENEKNQIDKNSSMFMIDLEEKAYGNVQIVVVNGEVTANSILGEFYEDMWNRNIFVDSKINIDKINKEIK